MSNILFFIYACFYCSCYFFSSRHVGLPEVKLRVRYINKRHELTFPGTHTIGEVSAGLLVFYLSVGVYGV